MGALIMQNATLIILIVISALLMVILHSHNKRIKINRIKKQLKSIRLNSQLKSLLITIQKQRGLCSRFKNGDTSLKAEIVNNLKTSETSINILEYQFDDFLNKDTRWMSLRNDWLNLKNNAPQLDEEESFLKHSLIIENILYLISSIAHKGQNDLQTSISTEEINIIWENIPQTLEAMWKTRDIGSGVASAGICTQANKIKLRLLSDEIIRNFNIVSNQLNNESLNDETTKVTIQISHTIDSFVEMVRNSLISAKSPEITVEPFFKQATDAMDGISQLFDKMSSIKVHQIERTLN